jgi:hypothetical protein
MEQLAAAPTAEQPTPTTEAVTITQALSVTAETPTTAAPAVQVEATVPLTPTGKPTATPTEFVPSATPTTQKQVVVRPTSKPTRAPARATVAPVPTRAPARPTATRVKPTPTRVKPTPTPEWPKALIITEQQLEQQAGSVPGLQVTGLNVSFANDSMTLSADSLRYSIVSIRNLTVQGHFTASNCDVTFVADRIQPRNLATSAIPNLVNQTLDQQLGQWCVESIAIAPGQLVTTVRPR